MSTDAKACYDKLDKAIVALSWFDDCTQSTPLRTLFFLTRTKIQTHPFKSRSCRDSDKPLHNYTTPSSPLLPCPFPLVPIKGLAWSVDRWRGKCDFEEKKWKTELEKKKNARSQWRKRELSLALSASDDGTVPLWKKQKPVSPHNFKQLDCNILSCEKENLLSKNEVLQCFFSPKPNRE